jgi:hypothetical protein
MEDKEILKRINQLVKPKKNSEKARNYMDE